ncbi:MAG: ATP-dependent DNA helicase RecG [Coriobacteriales bacterium]|nr:ATP-dependent DNA helicase RecG [Coriobacteriales bacterium]
MDVLVTSLRSCNERRAFGLERLGIKTLRDLLRHYPIRYNDFSQALKIIDAPLGERVSILAHIHEVKTKRPRPRLLIIEATLTDETGMFIASWFNQPWLIKQLQPGMELFCLGKMEHSYGYRRMSSPLFVNVEEDQKTDIQPVYRANSDISLGWIRRLINEALDALDALEVSGPTDAAGSVDFAGAKPKSAASSRKVHISEHFAMAASTVPGATTGFQIALLDPLPPILRVHKSLMSRRGALREIHLPQSMQSVQAARKRLAFEEVFLLQLFLQQRRIALTAEAIASGKSRAMNVETSASGSVIAELNRLLPFTLTSDQVRATSEILSDLAIPAPANRILLGDVGSGKTIVALHALLVAADNKLQAAMMAPTEILAEQYASQLGPMLDTLGIPWVLLTSSTPPAKRRDILQKLAHGEASIAFGTHALIESEVIFADLALVVIDEQHRFGVAQRDALRQKGTAVNYLAMTATPIPRSLALTLYGDFDCSFIRSRPQAKTRRTTKLIRKDQLAEAYEAVAKALGRGEQAYIVCPLIGEKKNSQQHSQQRIVDGSESVNLDDSFDEESDPPELITEFSPEMDNVNIRAAQKERDYLARQVFPNSKVALLTSRLKNSEKQDIMKGFRAGNIDVLVSTTVVEVGIDVPNATVMVIQDADRFGLSQLHQLRGRVGRGQKDGQICLVSSSASTDALERLVSLTQTEDGFELAEIDLALRREGDVTGSRQHGTAALKLVQVIRDADLISEAFREAQALLKDDPGLESPEHALLRYEVGLLCE